MKRILSALILFAFLFWGAAGVDSASLWTKYVATDKSYSFHYPSGWKVSTEDSAVGVENTRTDEQIMMVAIPFDQSKSPKDLANGFLVLLKNNNPNVSASNWQSQPESADSQVTFNLSDKSNGKVYSGLGIVIKEDQQATWFSYLAPAPGYSKVRSSNILQGFMGSIASGIASKAPTIDYNVMSADKIDRNAKAFIFVLEFALGSPFTKGQEDLILNELKEGWQSRSETELKKYDQYPPMVQTILKMNQKDLEELRASLEKSIREWLDETDKSDPAVKIILSQLKNRGKVIIAGDPPLTDMSLTAYSEIIAYSRLLQKSSKATPDQITQKSVDEIKQQVKKAWKSFSKDDRKDIATAPGLWVCQRVLLKNGSKAEQDKIRASLKKLGTVTSNIAASSSSPSTNTGTGSGDKKPMDMTTHWCMMQMQQQTFNMHMWSMGFNYLPATGKLW
ncbi:MAG TPA: hypothetical protein VHT96_16005 [Clostridia bacterium]|nr:hypothetical protein [Clostridia bacterium]